MTHARKTATAPHQRPAAAHTPPGRPAAISGRLLLCLMTSRLRGLLPVGLIGIGVQGRSTGRWTAFPVKAAPLGHALIVVPRLSGRRPWWRNLERPSLIRVCRGGLWRDADAWVIRPGQPGHSLALKAYRRRYPAADLPPLPLIIRIIPVPPSPVAPPLTPSGRAI